MKVNPGSNEIESLVGEIDSPTREIHSRSGEIHSSTSEIHSRIPSIDSRKREINGEDQSTLDFTGYAFFAHLGPSFAKSPKIQKTFLMARSHLNARTKPAHPRSGDLRRH